jgi:protein-tyrosine kinase
MADDSTLDTTLMEPSAPSRRARSPRRPAAEPTGLAAAGAPAAQPAAPAADHVVHDRSIGDIIAELRNLSAEQVEQVLQHQRQTGVRFGEAAVALGLASKDDVLVALSRQFHYPYAPEEERAVSPELVALNEPFGTRAEYFRALRSQLMMRLYAEGEPRRALAIISPEPGDGKTYCAANLAVTLAQLGGRTLLVDADMRGPRVHEVFKLDNRAGLSGILSGRTDVQAIQAVPGVPTLFVLPVGTVPPNPLELVERPAFGLLMRELTAKFDHVVVDTPGGGVRRRLRRHRRALRQRAGDRAQERQPRGPAAGPGAEPRGQPGQVGGGGGQRVLMAGMPIAPRDSGVTAARSGGLAQWAWALPLLAGLVAMYWPTYANLAITVWATDEQGHGPIILAIALWLIWARRGAYLALPDRPSPLTGSVGIACGLLLYLLGRTQQLDSFEVVSQIVLLAGLLAWFKGGAAVRVMAFPLLFMLFMVPLPSVLVQVVTTPLKAGVSYVAEAILHAVGYPVARSGVIIAVGPYQLLVADACAGLNSMFTLEALGLLYMNLMGYTSIARNTVLALLLIPIAFAANVVRVILLILVTYHFGDEAGQGFVHGFAGMVLFLVALALMFVVDRLLGVAIRGWKRFRGVAP